MSRLAGFALALMLAIAAGVSAEASAEEQKCTTAVANTANPGCGDAYRGMVLYGQVPAPGIPYTWSCNQCHSDSPLTDTLNTPAPAPSLIRAAPRDPGYIQFMMYKQPEAAPIMLAMESCCIGERPPDNVMGDLGDIAEFLYTCKMGIAPCVTGGGGGGGGGTTPGELQGSGSRAFGSKVVGSTSAALTLSLTNIGSGTVHISSVTNSNAADFTITSNTCASVSQTASCGITVTFHPSAAGARNASVTVTSDGLYSPQHFNFTGTGIVGAASYQGMWWNPSEDGWGINLEHQGDVIFATWFTYDLTGKAWWLVMIANAGADNTYAGKIYTTTGSSYLASTFSKGGPPQEVGAGVLTFADSGHATFAYTVNGGTPETKSIVPQQFGTLPTCVYSATANLATTMNYQGLWWNSNEDGWGINFAHQGAIIFASWFTFDVDTSPLWLVSIMQKGTGETFSGDLLRMTATPFNATPFKKNAPTTVGKAALAFANGNSVTFQYTIGSNGTITKHLTHQALRPGGTVCN